MEVTQTSEKKQESSGDQFRSVLISLVVVRDERGKFLVTNERYGWYMPAGRVDFGESFTTGATREALEEGGIHVKLSKIVKIQVSPSSKGYFRLRMIFTGDPIDPKEKPRDISQRDCEINEAMFCTLGEMSDPEKRPWRSHEPFHIFNHVLDAEKDNPSLLAPLSLYEGSDGTHIDNNRVEVKLTFQSTVVVFNDNLTKVLIDKDTQSLPTKPMTKQNCVSLQKLALSAISTQRISLKGLLRFQHMAPPKKGKTGFVHTYFLAEKATESAHLTFEDISALPNASLLNEFVSLVKNQSYAPMSIIGAEGEKL